MAKKFRASVYGLAMSDDGRTIVAGTDGQEALLFDEEGHCLWKQRVPGWWLWGLVMTADLSSDGQTVAVGVLNKTALILDRGGNVLGQHRTDADIYTVAVSADGQTIAAGSNGCQVYVFDRQSGLLWSEKLDDKIWAVALAEDGQQVIVGAGEKEAHLRAFNRQGEPMWRRYIEGSVSQVAAAPGCETIVVGSRTGFVYLFDGQGEPLFTYRTGGLVRDVAVSADGCTVAAASENGQVYGFLLERKRSTMNTLPDYKRKALEGRRESLIEEYDAIMAQLGQSLSAADELKLKRQAQAREAEIAEIEAQLQGRAPHPAPAPQPRKRTTGIPSDLSSPLKNTLLQCGEFADNQALQAVLTHEMLTPWRHSVPLVNMPKAQVDIVISNLADQYRADGQNALVIFLQVLAENYNEATQLHGDLLDLATQLATYK